MNQNKFKQDLNQLYNIISDNCEYNNGKANFLLKQAEKLKIKFEQQVNTTMKNKEKSLKGSHPEQFADFELKLAEKSQKLQNINNRIEKIKKFQVALFDLLDKLLCLCIINFENNHMDLVQQKQIQYNQLIACFEQVINYIKHFEEYQFIQFGQTIINNFNMVKDFLDSNNINLDGKKFEEQSKLFDQIRKDITHKLKDNKNLIKQNNKEVQSYVHKKQKLQKQKKFGVQKQQSEDEIESSESYNEEMNNQFVQNDMEYQEPSQIDDQEIQQINQKEENLSINSEEQLVEQPIESVIIYQLEKLNLKQQQDEFDNYQGEEDLIDQVELEKKLQLLQNEKKEMVQEKLKQKKNYYNAKLKMNQSRKTAKREEQIILQKYMNDKNSQQDQNESFIQQRNANLAQQIEDIYSFKGRIQQLAKIYKNQEYQQDKIRKKQQSKEKNQKKNRDKQKKLKKNQGQENQGDQNLREQNVYSSQGIEIQADHQQFTQFKQKKQKQIGNYALKQYPTDDPNLLQQFKQIETQQINKHNQKINFDLILKQINSKIENNELQCYFCSKGFNLYFAPCLQQIFCYDCGQYTEGFCKGCDEEKLKFPITD